MFTLIALTTLLATTAYAQDPEKTSFGSATDVVCPSSQKSDGGDCLTVTPCGTTSAWEVEMPKNEETEAAIAMVPGQVVGTNSIEMYAYHGAVNGRTIDEIVVNANTPDCNYPGKYWTKGVDASGATCFDVYRANIPWSIAYRGGGDMAQQLAQACNMKREQNATHVYFEGQATVKGTEKLVFDGVETERKLDYVIRFGLTQPRTITDITVTVTVLEDPRLLQAVTEQLFDYNTGLATLTVKISTASPLLTIADGLKATAPEGIAISRAATDPLVNVVGCDESNDNSCLQDHTFTIDPQAACEFDGVYSFDINVACRPDVAGTENCPVDMTNMPLQVNVTLDSEDICAVVTDLLEVDASMTSHGEFTAGGNLGTFGPEKSAFLQSQTMYFQLKTQSLNEFPFESTELDEVRAGSNALNDDPIVIYNKNTPEDALWGFEFASDQLTDKIEHIHMFSFSPAADSSFGAVARNMPVDSPIQADISIVFENSFGVMMTKKRTLTFRKRQVDPNKSATAEFIVTVEPGDNAPDTPMLLTDDDGAASSVAVALSALFVAAATIF